MQSTPRLVTVSCLLSRIVCQHLSDWYAVVWLLTTSTLRCSSCLSCLFSPSAVQLISKIEWFTVECTEPILRSHKGPSMPVFRKCYCRKGCWLAVIAFPLSCGKQNCSYSFCVLLDMPDLRCTVLCVSEPSQHQKVFTQVCHVPGSGHSSLWCRGQQAFEHPWPGTPACCKTLCLQCY